MSLSTRAAKANYSKSREGIGNSDQGLNDEYDRANVTADRSDRAAVILVGGRSSRFGSNKALYSFDGKPLLCHVVERLFKVTDRILVVAGRNEDRTQYHEVLPGSVGVVNDEYHGKTPLVGIATGLQAVDSEYVAVLSCDIPFVNARVVAFLFQRAHDADAAVPKWNKGHIEPLEAVYRRVPTLKAARETLAVPGLSLEDMIGKLSRAMYVSVEDEIARIDPRLYTFFNVNTREDIKDAEMVLAKQSIYADRQDPARQKEVGRS